MRATSLWVIVKNTTARTWGLGHTNMVSDMCVENYVTINQKDKVLDLTDSLRINPTDSVRIGLDLDSFAIYRLKGYFHKNIYYNKP